MKKRRFIAAILFAVYSLITLIVMCMSSNFNYYVVWIYSFICNIAYFVFKKCPLEIIASEKRSFKLFKIAYKRKYPYAILVYGGYILTIIIITIINLAK